MHMHEIFTTAVTLISLPMHAAESGALPVVTHMSLLGLLLAVGGVASLL